MDEIAQWKGQLEALIGAQSQQPQQEQQPTVENNAVDPDDLLE
jgi:hypothetical protein